MKKLQLGDKAPDFTLYDQNGYSVSPLDFKGEKAFTFFYPKAMTGG